MSHVGMVDTISLTKGFVLCRLLRINLRRFSFPFPILCRCAATVNWIKYFIVFHEKRHPDGMGRLEVEQFLTHLAVKRKVSVSTQKIALNALAFLYNRVLEQLLGELGEFNRANTPAKLPVVLSRHEMAH